MSNKVEKRGLVPKLRFPEFREAGEWERKPLAKVCNVLQGYGFPEALQGKSNGKYPFCKVSDISRAVAENGGLLAEATNYVGDDELLKLRAKLIPKGATVFAKIGEALRLNRRAYVQKECLIDNNATGLKAIDGVAEDYFAYLLSQLIDLNEHYGGAVPSVNKSTLEEIEVVVPGLDEQKRIADCLASLDERTILEAQKLDTLKTHKKGLMQQLFPAEGETLPKLRFPEFRDAGEWEFVPLKELASRRTERNSDGKLVRVLTNSAEHGVVDQRDYFDKDIATQGNLENYLIVDSGDFVYNPRISTFAPVGPISRNRIAKGVMSPLYTVFRFKNSGIDFYAHYFKTSAWHLYMRQVGSTGARHDRMAIANDDFLAMPLPAPLQEEQQKIADCLTSLDDL
ncbi:MAG: restriction endonuclease subunit S, partial [Gallionella sp.]